MLSSPHNNGSAAYNYLESSKSVDGGDPSGRGLSYNQWTFIAVTVDASAQQHKLYTATESLSPSLEATQSSTSQTLTEFVSLLGMLAGRQVEVYSMSLLYLTEKR